MHHLFDPHLVHPAFGDPGLYVDLREAHRALLFDLGDVSVLPPRKLLRLAQVFVTHAHMDHFAGFDALLRARSLGDLTHLVLDVVPGQRIGYVTDLRHTEANVRTLQALLEGVDLLCIECVFLEADAAHGARKHHLTARQAGEIARRVGAKAVLPFHFSPRYQGREAEIAAAMHAAWQGGGAR